MLSDETLKAAQLMVDYAALDPAAREVMVNPEALSSLLEYRIRDGEWHVWDDTIPLWDWYRYEYRRKPTPTLRPYTAEECLGLVGRDVVGSNGTGFDIYSFLFMRDTCLLSLEGGDVWCKVTPATLLAHYKFADGSPCGVEVE